MKLTPPHADMKLWTLLWAFIGCVGVYFGIADSNIQTVCIAVLQLCGAVGIWIGIPSAKWLLILFFFIGVLGRAYGLIFYRFNPAILPSILFLAFCAVRFIVWKPSRAE